MVDVMSFCVNFIVNFWLIDCDNIFKIKLAKFKWRLFSICKIFYVNFKIDKLQKKNKIHAKC